MSGAGNGGTPYKSNKTTKSKQTEVDSLGSVGGAFALPTDGEGIPAMCQLLSIEANLSNVVPGEVGNLRKGTVLKVRKIVGNNTTLEILNGTNRVGTVVTLKAPDFIGCMDLGQQYRAEVLEILKTQVKVRIYPIV